MIAKLKFLAYFFIFLFVLSYSVCYSETYILTDIGRGVEKIEVELLTPEPVYTQDSLDIKVYIVKFKNKELSVAAGMSGSPLISNGKIIGALFAAYSFQKEPLAFVLPIEYMDKIRDNYQLKVNNILNNSIPLLVFLPNQKVVSLFSNELKDYFPKGTVFKVGTTYFSQDSDIGDNIEVKSGESISVALVDGDIKIFATGTLTKIDKDGYFVAFGHPMFNIGRLQAPVYKSKVITVVDRYNDSFKLSAITNKKLGSIIFDTGYGILGKMGLESKMIPLNIDIYLTGKRIKNYNCFVVDNKNISYFFSLIAFYSVVSNYLESNLPYELSVSMGFSNGRVQSISIPSVNTPIDKMIVLFYEYFRFISSIPSFDNNLNFIKFSLNISPQNIGIINNISISDREDNNMVFDINYFDPLIKQNKRESIKIVFPTESANEDLYFGVGGEYNIPTIFEELGITFSMPKDFNQLITYTNFFSLSNPKSLSVIISTKLFGAIGYDGNIIPLTTPQLYKYYLHYSMPFIYLSYYPIIIKKSTNFIPVGYDIFQINVNGSISKTERKKEEKNSISYFFSSSKFVFKNTIYRNSVNQEIYFKDYDSNINQNSNEVENYSNNEEAKSEEDKNKEIMDNIVNLSSYEDLIDGVQNNVVIDYQANIAFSNQPFVDFKVDKNFFKIIVYNNQFLGFYYNFDNSTSLYIFDHSGKVREVKKFEGIFSDVRLSRNKLIASTFDGKILIINPLDFSIDKKINTDYVLQNVDFYKDYIVATNIKYPCSIVMFDINGKKISEKILPFINISNMLIDDDSILVACYGGMVLAINENNMRYFQTYQENVTALEIFRENLIIGTYPNPYIYVIPNYKNNSNFDRPILYDGFDISGYIEDIKIFKDNLFISYKSDKLGVFSINIEDFLGKISNWSQTTPNLNWYKNISPMNFYHFIPFVTNDKQIFIPYVSNTFTVIKYLDKNHVKQGEYISKVFDSGEQKYLYRIFVRSNGQYQLFIRMGNNPIVDQSWTNWIDYKTFEKQNNKYRYFQYKLIIYPDTIIYSVFGLFEKINYKPFFVVDLANKVYSSNSSIKVNFWDCNGDNLNVNLDYYDGKKWINLVNKQIKTKVTNINQPDFSVSDDLSLDKLNLSGKIKMKLRVDDSLSNPSNFFVQEQIFEIFVDNKKPIIKKYFYENENLNLIVEDDTFTQAFLLIGKEYIPLKLIKYNEKTYEYSLRIARNILESGAYIILKDEANNIEKINIDIK